MRLLDKILSQKPHSTMAQAMRETMYAFQVIACDPIAEHVNEAYWWKKTSVEVTKEFPFCQPPWNFSFCEWNMPGGTELKVDGRLIQQAGFFSYCDHFKELKSMFLGVTKEWQDYYKVNDETDVLVSTLVLCAAGRVYFPDHGPVATIFSPEGSATWVIAPPNGEGAMLLLSAVLATFTFANCCNVKLEDVTEELQPVPKIRRRLKLPEIRRYTLNIMGHTGKVSREWNEGEKGVMPWHLCRGHFATYTEEKPLFGRKGAIGRYWHPPHMKGKKENGVVIKDYAIKEVVG